MKNKSIISAILLGSLVVSPLSMANGKHPVNVKNNMTEQQMASSNKAIKSFEKKQNNLLKTVNKGVLEGYNKVLKATHLLSIDGKEKDAIKLLQEASGKFDIALAANPKLNLATIDANVSISELITTADLVKAKTDEAIDMLKEHKVQSAREILAIMRDEMVISTTYLPMGTYPTAIKLATRYLINGKKEDALTTLATALSTVVVEKAVVPLALVRAENLLKLASELDKNKGKEKAKDLLNAAQEQMQIAVLLGYADKNSKAYESIQKQIKAIKKEIKGKNLVEGLYDKVKSSLKNLIDDSKNAK